MTVIEGRFRGRSRRPQPRSAESGRPDCRRAVRRPPLCPRRSITAFGSGPCSPQSRRAAVIVLCRRTQDSGARPGSDQPANTVAAVPAAFGKTGMRRPAGSPVYRFLSVGRRGFTFSRDTASAILLLAFGSLAGCAGLDPASLLPTSGQQGAILPLLAAEPRPPAPAAIGGPATDALAARHKPSETAPGEDADPPVSAPNRPFPDPEADIPAPWTVQAGETLMQTLQRWGDRAGIAVFWDACQAADRRRCIDWKNQTSGRHDGSFDTALTWLLRGHGEAQPRPVAIRASNDTVRIFADGVSGSRL